MCARPMDPGLPRRRCAARYGEPDALARARDAVRICHGRRRRVLPDRRAQLDRRTLCAGPAADGACRHLAAGANRHERGRGNPSRSSGGDRSRVPADAGGVHRSAAVAEWHRPQRLPARGPARTLGRRPRDAGGACRSVARHRRGIGHARIACCHRHPGTAHHSDRRPDRAGFHHDLSEAARRSEPYAHLGYAWLVVGLALKGAAAFVETLPETAALHALTVGAVGTMMMAVMSRAALGHTGRKLVAHPVTVTAYALVSLAALLRLTAGAFPGVALLAASGSAWSLAWVAFLAIYMPILIRPRIDGQPG